jgi:hypothetical protein
MRPIPEASPFLSSSHTNGLNPPTWSQPRSLNLQWPRRAISFAPVSDLVRMKLTSFRLKDKVHIQDMDNAGLITTEIERSLPEALRVRLREVRETR